MAAFHCILSARNLDAHRPPQYLRLTRASAFSAKLPVVLSKHGEKLQQTRDLSSNRAFLKIEYQSIKSGKGPLAPSAKWAPQGAGGIRGKACFPSGSRRLRSHEVANRARRPKQSGTERDRVKGWARPSGTLPRTDQAGGRRDPRSLAEVQGQSPCLLETALPQAYKPKRCIKSV